jgi:hypothetical protein
MGSCCFTPTKRDFLWWYWLLLASIVGIPMLLAVLYVARYPDADEETKKRLGRRAAWIFWAGTWVVAVSIFFLVDALLKTFYSDPSDRSYWGIGYSVFAYRAGWGALAMQFFFATVAANGVNSLVRKQRWYVGIPVVIFCVILYLTFMAMLCPIEIPFRRPAIHAMQFLVCMLPAHYWGVFKDTPDASRAWKAFWAFLTAAVLFFLVSYFGEDFAQLICGSPPPW